jgi:type III secretion system chaperone SycN
MTVLVTGGAGYIGSHMVLALRDRGVLLLDMQSVGTVAVEVIGEREEDVSLSLSRRIEPPEESACTRLLELCHYREQGPFPVRAGLTGSGQLVFATRFETHDFSVPNIHAALDWLTVLHDRSSSFLRTA